MHIWSLQRRDRAANLAGTTRDVDHGIERLACERRKPVGHITVDPDETRACRNRTRETAGGAGHLMTGSTCMGRNRPPEKLAAAENENAHVTVRAAKEIPQ